MNISERCLICIATCMTIQTALFTVAWLTHIIARILKLRINRKYMPPGYQQFHDMKNDNEKSGFAFHPTEAEGELVGCFVPKGGRVHRTPKL